MLELAHDHLGVFVFVFSLVTVHRHHVVVFVVHRPIIFLATSAIALDNSGFSMADIA